MSHNLLKHTPISLLASFLIFMALIMMTENNELADNHSLERGNVKIKTNCHDHPSTSVQVEKTGGCNATVEPNDVPIVTRKELWAYYLYFSGSFGLGPLVYSLTLLQSLATKAAFNARLGRGHPCGNSTPSGACLIPWGNGTRSVSSVILIANGASFAIMSILLATLGSAADYGSFGRWLFLIVTLICWAAQFASMSLTSPNRWVLAMVLYMVGSVSYGAATTFATALLPQLARNTPYARNIRFKYERGEVSTEEFEIEKSMEINRISIISNIFSNTGYLLTLVLNLSILIPLAKNPEVNNYTIVLTNLCWVMAGIWWFVFRQPRPTPALPKGENYLTIGCKQIYGALRQYKKLPNTFIYLIASFLLTDGLNTSGTLVSVCQNDKFQFSFLQTTYLGLVQAVASILRLQDVTLTSTYISHSPAKFTAVNALIIIIPFWGMLGIWTTKIGFHNAWEFWVANVIFGLIAPFWAYSGALTAELTPPGFENMFFALFGLSNQISSIIGPNVIQAIINATQNNWQGFPFLFALCTAASLLIWFCVDVQKGQLDAIEFSTEKRKSRPSNQSDVTV